MEPTSYPFRLSRPQVPIHESRSDVSPSILLSAAPAATWMVGRPPHFIYSHEVCETWEDAQE